MVKNLNHDQVQAHHINLGYLLELFASPDDGTMEKLFSWYPTPKIPNPYAHEQL